MEWTTHKKDHLQFNRPVLKYNGWSVYKLSTRTIQAFTFLKNWPATALRHTLPLIACISRISSPMTNMQSTTQRKTTRMRTGRLWITCLPLCRILLDECRWYISLYSVIWLQMSLLLIPCVYSTLWEEIMFLEYAGNLKSLSAHKNNFQAFVLLKTITLKPIGILKPACI